MSTSNCHLTRVGNVNDDVVQAYIDGHPDDAGFRSIVQRAKEKGDFSHTKDHLTMFRLPREGE